METGITIVKGRRHERMAKKAPTLWPSPFTHSYTAGVAIDITLNIERPPDSIGAGFHLKPSGELVRLTRFYFHALVEPG
jgi:hypothetical protein